MIIQQAVWWLTRRHSDILKNIFFFVDFFSVRLLVKITSTSFSSCHLESTINCRTNHSLEDLSKREVKVNPRLTALCTQYSNLHQNFTNHYIRYLRYLMLITALKLNIVEGWRKLTKVSYVWTDVSTNLILKAYVPLK